MCAMCPINEKYFALFAEVSFSIVSHQSGIVQKLFNAMMGVDRLDT